MIDKITVHRCKPGEYERLERIIGPLWLDHYATFLQRRTQLTFDLEAYYFDLLRRRDVNAYIFQDGMRDIAGLTTIEFTTHLVIDDMFIDPIMRGKGLGRKLVEFARNSTRVRKPLMLNAMKYNVTARAFYKRLGGRQIRRGTWRGNPTVTFRWESYP